MLDPIRAWVVRAMDAGVLWQLAHLPVEPPYPGTWGPADATAFWAESRLRDPAVITAGSPRQQRRGVEVRVLTGASRGPGSDPGSQRLVATVRIRRGRRDIPFVLLVHGLLAPSPWYEERQGRLLAARGAHVARIDLPFHLRRRSGRRSGEGYIRADLRWTREVVRQSVEDCAAVLAWARAELSDRVMVWGTSLGGLIALLLAAQLSLARAVAVAPFCDPVETVLEHLPGRTRRVLGLVQGGGGVWGADRAAARAVVADALAPIVVRNLLPGATRGGRVAIVRPALDGIVGDGPMAELAALWGAELWNYPLGHVSVVNAHGLGGRVRRWLLASDAAPADGLRAAGQAAAPV